MALRCLVVDDSRRFLDAASILLERGGIAVVGVATTSTDALAQVELLRPDVVVVDIDLAGESGFELARQLQARGWPAPAKIILISTHAEDDFHELIAASPAVGFLSKTVLSSHAIRALLSATVPECMAADSNGTPEK